MVRFRDRAKNMSAWRDQVLESRRHWNVEPASLEEKKAKSAKRAVKAAEAEVASACA